MHAFSELAEVFQKLQLLDYWGLPNLQAINRDVHAAKCAAEARDRHAARHLAPELA
jgi:hypothetical protein